MELRHLRYFLAVADELHFGRAAARLRISQPPLSQQIRLLEAEVGAELFSRDTRRVELTAAGREFMKYAQSTFAQVEQGVRSARRVDRGEVGQIRVGFMTSMAYTYLPWMVRAFRDKFPNIELVLTEMGTPNQIEALQMRRLDIAVVRGPVEKSDLVTTTALTEPFLVALPDRHPSARKSVVRLEALAREPFIMYPKSIGGRFYEEVSTLFRDAGFSPTIAQEAVQMHVAIGLVTAGLGVALAPASVQLLSMPGVVFRPLSRSRGKAQIVIAHLPDVESPSVRAFRQISVEVISKGVPAVRRWRSLSLRGKAARLV